MKIDTRNNRQRVTWLTRCCLALLACCTFGMTAWAQNVNGYTFSTSTGNSLDPMTGSTQVIGTGVDDTPSPVQGIGFTFVYEGASFTQFTVSPDGWIRLGGSTSTNQFSNSLTSATNTPKISALWDDLATGSNGSVRTLVTGAAPNRILKVQWNVTVPRNTTGAANSTFQAWLYETSGLIEFRYGVVGTPGSASVGLTGATSTNINSVTISTNTNSVTTANDNNSTSPGNGRMYTFQGPSCLNPGAPGGLTATGITQNSATIGWTAGAFATSYAYEVRTSGTCGSGATGLVASGTTSSLSQAITGLNSGTTYTYCVRSLCSGASNYVSGSFTTACGVYPLPFNEGFNATTIPNCWSQQFVSASSNIQYVASSTAPVTAPFEGTHYVYWNSFSYSSGNSTRLVSPAIVTTGTASVDVNFRWFAENNPSYTNLTEGMQVQWSLDDTTWTDAGSFISRHDPSFASGSGGWLSKSVTLPAAAGNQATIYIGFRFVSRFGDNCSMDAVGVAASPSCAASSSVSFASITPFTATANWSAVLGAVSYQYEVRTSGSCGSGATGLVTSGTTAGTSVNLTGLSDNTAYTVCVQTNCGTLTSTYNSGSFITPIAPPANDNCAGATPLPCGGSVSGNTTGATDETGLPTCGSSFANTRGVWHTFTPSSSGSVTIATCGGASWDTYLRVYTGSCGSLSCVTSDDDGCSTQSTVTINVTGGTTYYVLVSGFSTSSFGTYTLTSTVPTATVGAITGPSTVYCGINNTYSVPAVSGLSYNWSVTNGTIVSGQGTSSVVLNWGGGSNTISVTSANICGATASNSVTATCTPPPPCFDGTIVNTGSVTSTTCGAGNESSLRSSEDLIYRWTVSTPGCYTLSTCNSVNGFDTYLYVTSLCPGIGGTPNGGTTLASNDDFCGLRSEVELTVAAGTYYIVMEGFSGCGNFTLDVNACPPPPANDDCSNATTFVGSSMPFTTVRATGSDITSCTFGDVNDVWYAWTAPSCGRVTFTTCGGASFDTGLSIFTSCGGSEIVCNDDFSGCGLQSSVSTNVTAGTTYYVRVAGYSGAVGSGTIFMSLTAPLAVTTSGQNVSCFGGANGSATASATGGSGTTTYLWSNGATTASISGLAAGTYTVTVTDGLLCTATATHTVTQPTALAGSLLAQNYNGYNISCNGGNDGMIFANISGGTPGYSYSWSNGGNAQMATGLTAGTYSVTVTDANGCTYSQSITLTEPAALSAGVSAATFSCGTNVSCNGATDGSINLTVTGGTGNYAFAWSNGSTNEDLSGLGAGTYSVVVTDQNGCSTSASITLTQPALLVASLNQSTFGCGYGVSCYGATNGTLAAAVSGGCAPYSYAWSTGGIGGNINGLAAGMYSVTVTDANGCQAFATAELTQPAPVAGSGVASLYNCGFNVSCNGATNGSIDYSVAGGCAPYTFLWSNGATTEDVNGLGAGSYTVTATDANGCSTTNSFTLTQPAPLTVSCPTNTTVYLGWPASACATLTASGISGGCAPYSIAWSNGATTASTQVCPTVSTDYTVTVTDANGCTASCTVRVCVIDVRCGNNLQKIEICHNGNTICVAPSAVATHLGHGDFLGACGTNLPCAAPLKTDATSAGAAHDHEEMVEMEAFPNPFQSSTTLRFTLPTDDNVKVVVYAMDGRNMGTIFEGTVEGHKSYEAEFRANGAANGIYFAKLISSNGEESVMKLVLMK